MVDLSTHQDPEPPEVPAFGETIVGGVFQSFQKTLLGDAEIISRTTAKLLLLGIPQYELPTAKA